MSQGNKAEIKLPIWRLDSYKGQMGKVLVIGGSMHYYGAPILAALGAEAAGADLITLIVPPSHAEAAKSYSLNFLLNSFQNSELSVHDVRGIISLSEQSDVVVIGNGIGQSIDVQRAVLSILNALDIPVIIDAQALFPAILSVNSKYIQNWILTPHRGEFKRLFGCEITQDNLVNLVDKYGFTLCLKGMIDHIVAPNMYYENKTGVPQMRVGGTGDVLSGIIAAYHSLGIDSFNSAKSGAFLWGKCGEELFNKKYTLTAHDMIKCYGKAVLKLIKKSSESIVENKAYDDTSSNNTYN